MSVLLTVGIIFGALRIAYGDEISSAISISSECMKLFKLHKNPLECCIYPKLEADDLLIRKCRRECPAKMRTKYNCCYRSCLFAKSEIFDNNSFNRTNCESYFTYSEIQNDLNEKWKEVVKESLANCEHEVQISDKTTADSCVPNYVHEILTCSWKENFSNCPSFNDEDNTCTDMKLLVNECAKTDGKFIFSNFFFGNQMVATSFS